VRVTKAWDHRKRPTWFADLDGIEVASGKESNDKITWHADEDVPLEFEALLDAEIDRLARHGYTSSIELDRHIREGRVRALGN
jgi:hypothetical protein